MDFSPPHADCVCIPLGGVAVRKCAEAPRNRCEDGTRRKALQAIAAELLMDFTLRRLSGLEALDKFDETRLVFHVFYPVYISDARQPFLLTY